MVNSCETTILVFCIPAEILRSSLPVLTRRTLLSALIRKKKKQTQNKHFTVKTLGSKTKYIPFFHQWPASLLHLCITPVILTDTFFSCALHISGMGHLYKISFSCHCLTDKNCCNRGINFKTLTWEPRETRLVKYCDPAMIPQTT